MLSVCSQCLRGKEQQHEDIKQRKEAEGAANETGCIIEKRSTVRQGDTRSTQGMNKWFYKQIMEEPKQGFQ